MTTTGIDAAALDRWLTTPPDDEPGEPTEPCADCGAPCAVVVDGDIDEETGRAFAVYSVEPCPCQDDDESDVDRRVVAVD